MVFHAQELAPLLRKKDVKPTEQYDALLERALARVKSTAQQGGTQCFYEVPRFVPGFPLLDVRSCAAYLILKLRRLDFQVQWMPSGHLWIAWFHVQPPAPKPALLPPPSHTTPVPPAPELDLDAATPANDAVRKLQKVYDEASIDVLTRLAPRLPTSGPRGTR